MKRPSTLAALVFALIALSCAAFANDSDAKTPVADRPPAEPRITKEKPASTKPARRAKAKWHATRTSSGKTAKRPYRPKHARNASSKDTPIRGRGFGQKRATTGRRMPKTRPVLTAKYSDFGRTRHKSRVTGPKPPRVKTVPHYRGGANQRYYARRGGY